MDIDKIFDRFEENFADKFKDSKMLKSDIRDFFRGEIKTLVNEVLDETCQIIANTEMTLKLNQELQEKIQELKKLFK